MKAPWCPRTPVGNIGIEALWSVAKRSYQGDGVSSLAGCRWLHAGLARPGRLLDGTRERVLRGRYRAGAHDARPPMNFEWRE